MLETRNRTLFFVCVTLSVLVAAGCGKPASTQRAERADKVLEQFLDAWSRGESADKFADPTRPIQGSDPDWKAGYRLLSFLSGDIKPSPESSDHIRCPVSLSLQAPKGKRFDKQVVYDVQLGEKTIIKRVSP